VEILVEKSNHFIKGEAEAAISAAIGWGLLVEEGASHKAHQRAMRPGFRAQALEEYLTGVTATAEEWVASVRDGGEVALVDSVRRFTQQSAERSLFMLPSNPTDFSYQESVLALNDFVNTALDRYVDGPASVAAAKEYRKHREVITSHVSGLVREWQSGLLPSTAFFEYLTADLTEEDGFGPYHQQVSLFLQAATETTGSLLSWTFLYLNRFPEYWSALIEEAEVHGPISSMEDMKKLPWANAVLKEVLRLSPPAWILPRIALEKTTIGGVVVLPGTKVIVSPWVTHRDSSVFPDAEEFRPERWISQPGQVTKGGYFPFGMGDRICIGERFGKMTALVLLHSVARRGLVARMSADELGVASSAVIINPGMRLRVRFEGHEFAERSM